MIRFLSFLLPVLAKGPGPNPTRKLVGLLAFGILVVIGVLTLSIALYMEMSARLGASLSMALIALTYLIAAAVVWSSLNQNNGQPLDSRKTVEQDALAPYLPDAIKQNPTFKNLTNQVAENPVLAVTLAFVVGRLLSSEFIKD